MPVCIDISDSRLVSEYGIYSEPCALGIGALSGNVESVELFRRPDSFSITGS